ncbi:MAG: M23 family metallopeptidase [Negativicutes bacterium]|nr:M23 family metallopeptidase [Negativicutes bacterium]
MPNLPRKARVLFAYLKLLFLPGWLMPKPIYTACGLLLIAGILMMSVIYSLKDAATGPRGGDNFALVGQSHPQPQEPVVIIQPEPIRITSAHFTAAATTQQVSSRAPDYEKESPRWPVRGQISYDFGWQKHPLYNDWRYHNGIDIETAESIPVQAVLGGAVEEIYNDKNYGQTVVVKSGRYTIIYSSLDSVVVNKNDKIENGAQIGRTGSYITEPSIHVHLTVKDGAKFIDPRSLLK